MLANVPAPTFVECSSVTTSGAKKPLERRLVPVYTLWVSKQDRSTERESHEKNVPALCRSRRRFVRFCAADRRYERKAHAALSDERQGPRLGEAGRRRCDEPELPRGADDQERQDRRDRLGFRVGGQQRKLERGRLQYARLFQPVRGQR